MPRADTLNGWKFQFKKNGAVEALDPISGRHRNFPDWSSFWNAAHGRQGGGMIGKTLTIALACIVGGIIATFFFVVEFDGSKSSTSSPSTSSQPAIAIGNAQTMINDTGCPSHYSEDKKADLFNAGYRNRVTTATGQITKIEGGQVLLKILSSTLTYDLEVNLRDKSRGYNLQQGQVVTMRFIPRRAGGCFLPFDGNDGVIQ